MAIRKGRITFNDVILEKHELRTVVFLSEKCGYNIELLPPSQRKGDKTPDMIMNGLKWEMKAPKSASKYTLQNILHKAVKQSPNIIIDLRRSKMLQEQSLPRLEREFKLSKGIKRLIIITKGRKILHFET
jgi:hypothetical protein